MLHPDPFRDIDRLAAQLLGTSPGSARVPLAMPTDLYRSGDHYVLHADLPGTDPDSVFRHNSCRDAAKIDKTRLATLTRLGRVAEAC